MLHNLLNYGIYFHLTGCTVVILQLAWSPLIKETKFVSLFEQLHSEKIFTKQQGSLKAKREIDGMRYSYRSIAVHSATL